MNERGSGMDSFFKSGLVSRIRFTGSDSNPPCGASFQGVGTERHGLKRQKASTIWWMKSVRKGYRS